MEPYTPLIELLAMAGILRLCMYHGRTTKSPNWLLWTESVVGAFFVTVVVMTIS